MNLTGLVDGYWGLAARYGGELCCKGSKLLVVAAFVVSLLYVE